MSGEEFRLPQDPVWCQSVHDDPDTDREHWTDLDGILGHNVAITWVEGDEPVISLVELEHPQHDLTLTEARMHAAAVWSAAAFADRVGAPTVEQIAQQVADLLKQRE